MKGRALALPFQNIIGCCNERICTFLASPRKVPKECDLRRRFEKAPSLRILPPHRQPVSKNVPIFEHLRLRNLRVFSRQTGENRYIFASRMEKRQGIPKGAPFRSAPLADFFGYFLVRKQESNIENPFSLSSSGYPICTPYFSRKASMVSRPLSDTGWIHFREYRCRSISTYRKGSSQ